MANLALYLVTDSRPEILGDRDLCTVVEEALKGGVTIVQYRDKHSDTSVLIETAEKLHHLTKAYNVPLIINDRVDVALAVGAEGVHLGQDDMSIETARKLLPESAIIGATVSSVEEAEKAIKDGAGYLGIGTVYSTSTKTNTKSIIGPAGVRDILNHVAAIDEDIGTVAIGGITLENVQSVVYRSWAAKKGLQGVAIVSAIMGAADPKAAAAEFTKKITAYPPFATHLTEPRASEAYDLLTAIPSVVGKVAAVRPLCHSMINFVVANFAANALLAVGASPIMSLYGEEAPDIAANNGGLLINIGTLTEGSVDSYLKAVHAYNAKGNPVVLDPVGAAATEVRRTAVKKLMSEGYFDLIKGNEAELRFISGHAGRQAGVDSGPSSLGSKEKAIMTLNLAKRERCIVLLTGPSDFLSDGRRIFSIGNGHEYLGQITGSGCIVGALAAAFLSAYRDDKLLAVLAALLMFEVAAERAAAKEYVRGPGSFVAALLDELYALRRLTKQSPETNWVMDVAKLREVTEI